MDSITVENFRCFKNRQTARLAPLTLLVGENSTGKSSFMAMIGILWHSVISEEFKPSFKNHPFDLGTFSDVIHGNKGEEFSGGFNIGDYKSEIKFRKGNIDPEAYWYCIKNSKISITITRFNGRKKAEVQYKERKWVFDTANLSKQGALIETFGKNDLLFFVFEHLRSENFIKNNPEIYKQVLKEFSLINLQPTIKYNSYLKDFSSDHHPPWVSSPFQAGPHRVYTPGGGRLDPDGEFIPAYLAELASSNDQNWQNIKDSIESFGKMTGVFDELNIRFLGEGKSKSSDPFQIQVRKAQGNNMGEWRNLMDVGFGVSQLLPILVHLARPSTEYMLNFQQPEVHLHPSGQAGLGSLLCEAATKKQILVETHSDNLIKRVRMDIRDKITNLKHEDVSILYFERTNIDEVKIHNISIDEHGNIINQPEKYREFFTKESNRFLEI